MSWFDGTVEWLDFENEYPMIITEDFRMSQCGDRLAIINRFPKESYEYELADPHMEELNYMNGNRFYHVVTGKDAEKVQNALKEFLMNERNPEETSVTLFRVEKDEAFSASDLVQYSYGDIASDIFTQQEELHHLLPAEYENMESFIVPLSVHFFACPICGARTLQYRGMCEICEECFWEDDAGMMFGNNGPFTEDGYREWFQEVKRLYPNESGEQIHDRVMAGLSDDCPGEIDAGLFHLWKDCL